MAIILPPSNLFVTNSWTLQKEFDADPLPDVSAEQKRRADKLEDESMPVIGKNNRYFGHIKLSKIFAKLKEYSLEIEISGKTAYYIGGKELASQTAKKLRVEALPYIQEKIRDIDLRIFVRELNQYNSFIDFIHSLFPRIDKGEIINNLLLASHSDAESISFTIGDKNSITCDILFVVNPARLHLFYRDAFRYSIKDNKFVSDLKHPLQALSDYYYNVVQTDNPESINKKGWPKFLVAKAKGARIPDHTLEEKLFKNVVNSKKRKDLPLEIVDLLTKAAAKAGLSYSGLLFEGSCVLEKSLNPETFKTVWSKADGKIAEGVKAGIPFHVIYAYLQYIGKINGEADLECLFATPHKKALDDLFSESLPLEERLAPSLFRLSNPKRGWDKIKSKSIAATFLPLLIEKDPVLAFDAAKEFSLSASNSLYKALLERGYAKEANSIYDECGDIESLEELTLMLLQSEPARAVYDQYRLRVETVTPRLAIVFIENLEIKDLIELEDMLKSFDAGLYEKRTGPHFVQEQIENPKAKAWRKLIEYADSSDIEPWFLAILEKVSVNEARLFCLHETTARHPKHAEMVKKVANSASLSQKSLYWDILDLCLSYHLPKAAQLLVACRGNMSGLPRNVLARIADKRIALFEQVENPFPLAECLNDLNIAPVSLVEKVVIYKFDSPSLLKAGWLGNAPLDLETSTYFIEHSQFETFYPSIISRLHPDSPLEPYIGKLIDQKKFRAAADLTTKKTASKVLIKLRGFSSKERVELLKKFGTNEEWEIYLKEEKKSEDIFSYLLSGTFSDRVKLICIEHSAKAWEPYFDNPDLLKAEDVKSVSAQLFKKGMEAKKNYMALKKLKEKSDALDKETEDTWEKRCFEEEPYNLQTVLKQPANSETCAILTKKLYIANPPKTDYARLQPWLKDIPAVERMEIELYFEPDATVKSLMNCRPDMLLFERLFLKLIEMKEFCCLKDAYIQFNNDYRKKYRTLFLRNCIKDAGSLEYASREFEDIDPNDKDFETEFIISLFDAESCISKCDWSKYNLIWTRINYAIECHSKARTKAIPPSEDLDDEFVVKGFLKGPNLKISPSAKARRAEAAHSAKLYLIPAYRALKLRHNSDTAQLSVHASLMEVVPFHFLLTSDLDEAIFDYISMIPPSLESTVHPERCVVLLNKMKEQGYFSHYSTSLSAFKAIIDATVFPAKKAETESEYSARNEIEKNFVSHIPSIQRAFKRTLEFNDEYNYLRAWHLLSNVQEQFIEHKQYESLIKLYQPLLLKLPKYCFNEIRPGIKLINLVKNLTQNLFGPQIKEPIPIFIQNLIPLYLEAIFESFSNCPPNLQNPFIADIMVVILQYTHGNLNLILKKFILFTEKIIDLAFDKADKRNIEMFTHGISNALSSYVSSNQLHKDDQDRISKCLNKLRNALIASTHLSILNSLIIQWSFSQKTLNYIDNQV